MTIDPANASAMAAISQRLANSSYILKTKRSIQHLGLIRYLAKRGIPLAIAHRYLKEVRVYNIHTHKNAIALGFPNEEGGLAIRNPFFATHLGPPSISFIRGLHPKPKGIHVFSDFMDYLSAIARQNGQAFKADTIILHSLECLNQVVPYIHQYGYEAAYSWINNDPDGDNATRALQKIFQTQALKHIPMNSIYAPHPTVNSWHIHQLTTGQGAT